MEKSQIEATSSFIKGEKGGLSSLTYFFATRSRRRGAAVRIGR